MRPFPTRGSWVRALGAGVVGLALAAGLAAPAAAAPTWSTATSGPAFTTPQGTLDAAIACGPGTTNTSRPVALFIPGTTLTPDENFSWNYFRAFRAAGRPYCSVELPNHAMSDIQVSAEYVVNAIRSVQAHSGQKVALVGFSQGGMIGRWALKYWPDTRTKVGQYVAIDPSNHGTLDSYPACTTGCAPSIWQQASFSHFLGALNAGVETYAGINYTSMWTPTDEVVFPNLPPAESSRLNTGAGGRANISTFDVCPGHVADHLSMGSIDPVAYGLVIDALDHGGLASAARVPKTVCVQPFQPGVDPVTGPARFAAYVAGAGYQVATYPRVPAEPPLMPYATAG
ncbi:esterase/lipase family protein [Actinomycetospora chiangmaiensis]|uniref:esterase/lipase family protein n=1 Tax=Actinomycetospora chiangmaiensis TaxID=402650 RepID=UPI0003A608CE|nr:alpha/beta fold hydrolase [Actinomycetospora chiangmaiensis]